MTHSGRGTAGPQETAAWHQDADPWPRYEPPGAAAGAPGGAGPGPFPPEEPWELDLRTEPPEQRYRSRRELRDERDRQGEAPTAFQTPPAARPAAPQGAVPPERRAPGPTTQELAVYRAEVQQRLTAHPGRHGSQAGLVPWEGITAGAATGRSDRVKGSVERWSRWASGLGLPPRDGSGYGRYAKADRLFPPAVWIAAGLGAAGLVGLLTGVLVGAPSSGGPAAAAAVTSTSTVTVTQDVTAAPVTETTTRTRTKTVTATAPTQDPVGGVTLAPGSQGPQVAQLQADLAALGLFPGPPNGSYDEATRAGVQAFQAQHGVTGDPPGVAGPATLSAVDQARGR